MTRARDIASGLGPEAGEGKPHIIPGVLYPSYVASGTSNKLLDGTTSHSGAFGTAQSDGRKYYYTNIAGSKPIKDPRIGAHFGSQRHKFRSLQLLEQETATHGDDVYSIDGREWCRAVGSKWSIRNDSYGHTVALNGQNVYNITTQFIEVVGYFNQANLSAFTNHDAPNTIDCLIDGTDTGSNGSFETSVASPIAPSRYVDGTSLINLPLGSTTLGLHTLRISVSNSENISIYFLCGNLELIAHDTSNVNEIKIPKQNVVSYGKKFEVGSDTLGDAVHPHYDPFNGFVDDTTLFSAKVDTATSLGLGTATTWGAPWDTGSDDHIRPFNGGRVVKWVDSDGTIKTSVTMMPRNAQNIGTTASNEITDVSSTNTQTINFSDDAVEHSLSEVAKTFHWREFGNGSANGGAGATYADASMLDATSSPVRNIAFVMDDGLTSLSGSAVIANTHPIGYANTTDKGWYFTFIGTGFTFIGRANGSNVPSVPVSILQNLPYGTHVVKIFTKSDDQETTVIHVDGVQVYSANDLLEYAGIVELTIHQPKKPPIPEDAVILADYMLMADFVAQTVGTVGHISKGVRVVDASRDFFMDGSTAGGPNVTIDTGFSGGYAMSSNGSLTGTCTLKLPYFGTDFLMRFYASRYGTFSEGLNSWGETVTYISSSAYEGIAKAVGNTLAVNQLTNVQTDGQNDDLFYYSSAQIATPTHSSHHYQSFETPFLHELVGGDRNMEQTNLIVSPDGKTWDQLTRDTSYIGNIAVHCEVDADQTTVSTYVVFDEWRGTGANAAVDAGGSKTRDFMQKYFAIAHDKIICLKHGQYEIVQSTFVSDGLSGSAWAGLYINGEIHTSQYNYDASFNQMTLQAVVQLERGDYIQYQGAHYSHGFGTFYIKKI